MKNAKYANEYAPNDGILRVHCLHHESEHMKADSYLIELDGGLWLIDGGMAGSLITCDYLHNLRSRWLVSAGMSAECGCRLKLNWFVSHFHIDHVSAALESIIPDGAFELDTLYLPPDSALAPVYHEYGVDGDTKYRPQLAAVLEKYGSGRERIVNIEFGEENVLEFTDNTGKLCFTIFPTPYDGGVGERLEYMIDNYYDGNRYNKMVATAAVNSCCPWLHIICGNKTFLFTGDLMKRESYLDNEAVDEMVRTYGGRIGDVDVIKYPHHGFKRDAAAPVIMEFNPGHIIVSCKKETATQALRAAFPDKSKGVQIHNCAQRDIIFSTDGTTLTVDYAD